MQTLATIPREEKPRAPRPRWEVADILRSYVPQFLQKYPVSSAQRKVLTALMACRTTALGGHLERCDSCGYQQVAYNSCRDRHCPKCQSLAQAQWLAQRRERILPVSHFHVVFTLPAELRPVVLRNQRTLYGLLFEAATKTLLTFGRDPKHLGAQLGITAVLHTWSRTLAYHPHLHCIVTGGGLSPDGARWVPKTGRFLFPVKALARVFRAQFLGALRALYREGALDLSGTCVSLLDQPAFDALLQTLFSQDWVVYAKRPFGDAEKVFAYLGRYTHRVGLSNHRIRLVDDQGVCFTTKHGKSCTLAPLEFIRRFLLHVLPAGFVKVRHYGLLCGCNVETKLARARTLLTITRGPEPGQQTGGTTPADGLPASAGSPARPAFVDQIQELTGRDLTRCPQCKRGRLIRFQVAPAGGRCLLMYLSPPGTSDGALVDSS